MRPLSPLLALTVCLAVVGPGSGAASAAVSGPQNFPNSKLAEAALKYVGKSRSAQGFNAPGQCIVWVRSWVREAGGYLAAGYGPLTDFKKSPAREVSAGEATRGDVFQISLGDTFNGSPHTGVLLGPRRPDGAFAVIEGNVPAGSGRVVKQLARTLAAPRRHRLTFWRFGKVATKDRDRDRDGVPDKQDKCPGKKGPRSNRGCPPRPRPERLTVRGTYTPISGDFNGDGNGDILWYGPGEAADSLWYGGPGQGQFAYLPTTVKGTYTPISGDFNGDGNGDILWYGPGEAADSLWYGGPGQGQFAYLPTTVKGTYTPISGDFNGDGNGDILWYGPGEAYDTIWFGRADSGSFASPG
jgi:hypothetical protein